MCCGNGSLCGPQGVDGILTDHPEVREVTSRVFGRPGAPAPVVEPIPGVDTFAIGRAINYTLRPEGDWQADEHTGAVAAIPGRMPLELPEPSPDHRFPDSDPTVINAIPAGDDGLGRDSSCR